MMHAKLAEPRPRGESLYLIGLYLQRASDPLVHKLADAFIEWAGDADPAPTLRIAPRDAG